MDRREERRGLARCQVVKRGMGGGRAKTDAVRDGVGTWSRRRIPECARRGQGEGRHLGENAYCFFDAGLGSCGRPVSVCLDCGGGAGYSF